MANGKDYTSFILEDLDRIKNFVGQMSTEMLDYIESNTSSKFTLFYKHLTHSDLATFGKATKVDSHEKNLLYYITKNDMLDIESNTGKAFQTAHQSCIGLRERLYEIVGLPNPRKVDPYLINDYMDVYVVNSNMKYFHPFYTQKVFDKLNKEISPRSRSWDFTKLEVKLNNEKFTPIKLHVAVHGLGMEEDQEFHKIRHHLFKGDSLLLLFEEKDDVKNLYLLFEKNPIFFSLIGETNKSYVKYLERIRKRLINRVTAKDNAVSDEDMEDEITRSEQSAWRDMLANEMMAYTQEPRQIFCPFTYISCDYDSLGTLFVASHIKGFKDPNTLNEEKFDVNNGLLLSCNADALFDKHLITIGENKELIFSYLLDSIVLKQQLLLLQPIFKPLLNEKRMKYLEYHRNVFLTKEQQRKGSI